MGATLLARTTPVARATHRCHMCAGVIHPGTRYENQRIAANGSAWTYKAHAKCHDLAMQYADYWALEDEDMPYWGTWSEVLEWWEGR